MILFKEPPEWPRNWRSLLRLVYRIELKIRRVLECLYKECLEPQIPSVELSKQLTASSKPGYIVGGIYSGVVEPGRIWIWNIRSN